METDPFVIERTYNAKPDKVWQAITDKDKMKEWYFDLKEFKPEVGFEFEFTGGPPGKIYLHLCKVIEVIPGKKLKHSWRYDGYTGESFVTWELFDEGDKTRVKLTHAGLETFPPDSDFKRKSFAMGWADILSIMLPKYLEKTQ
jgi:uncharacterized protein YndB with AHSA1/START domain